MRCRLRVSGDEPMGGEPSGGQLLHESDREASSSTDRLSIYIDLGKETKAIDGDSDSVQDSILKKDVEQPANAHHCESKS